MTENNQREKERAELYKTLWAFANDVRGQVDGWDFKAYVLTLLFYRYVSEYMERIVDENEHASGRTNFSYAELDDETAEKIRDAMIKRCGYFIRPSQLFRNVRKTARGNENLNDDVAKAFRDVEDSTKGTPSEEDFKGLFSDMDPNSPKLGSKPSERRERLTRLLDVIGSMNFGTYGEGTTDLFGDAYEYLMGMYASSAGKSGGEYYTPPEVSRLLMELATADGNEISSIYDPACGSGSLLLQAKKILSKKYGPDSDEVRRIKFFGQEKNLTTYNLCRMNLVLHGVRYDKMDVRCGDTLTNPAPAHDASRPFDAVVSNPPYSLKWRNDGMNDVNRLNDERFAPAGILAPKSYADMAFVLHCLSWISESGTAAMVCFPGVMYRGGAEQKIRKYLVDGNYVHAVIRMPENLFYGTTVPVNLLIMKKNKPTDEVLFIDASNEKVKVTNANKLTEENMRTILGWYEDAKPVPHRVAVVGRDEIEKEKYSLSVSTYVEPEDDREKVDVDALNAELDAIVARSNELRARINEIVSDLSSDVDLFGTKEKKGEEA